MILDFATLTTLGVLAAVTAVLGLLASIYSIGPTQIGLVRKRFGAKLPGDNPLAFRGEAGYQAEMLMPGLRFKLWLVFAVTKHPWVQVPAGQIGVVIAAIMTSQDSSGWLIGLVVSVVSVALAAILWSSQRL